MTAKEKQQVHDRTNQNQSKDLRNSKPTHNKCMLKVPVGLSFSLALFLSLSLSLSLARSLSLSVSL